MIEGSNTQSNIRIAKNTLHLYFRSILLIVISLYTSRVVLQVLGIDDYGIYNLIGGFVVMFSMISSTLASASQRFITYSLVEKSSYKTQEVYTTSLTLHIIIGILLVIVLECCGHYILNNYLNIPEERLDAANWVLQCSIFSLFVNVVTIPFNSLIIAYEKMSVFAYISLFEVVLKLAAIYPLMFVSYDKLIIYSILIFLVSVIVCFTYFGYCYKRFPEASLLRLKLDKTLFKEMFSFSGWNLLGNGSMVLRNQGVDIILNLYFGVVINASKGISNQVQQAVFLFVGNFFTAITPQLTKSIAKKDLKRTHELINQGGRLSFCLYVLFCVPLFLVIPQVLNLWLTVVPEYAVEFVRWLLVYSMIDSFSRLLITSILANGIIRKYEIKVSTIKIMAVPLAWIYLAVFNGSPLIGIWVNIVMEIICLIVRLNYAHKFFSLSRLDYFIKVICRSVITFIIAFAISYFIYKFYIHNMFVLVPISLIVTLLTVFYVGMNKQERNFIVKIINNKINSRK